MAGLRGEPLGYKDDLDEPLLQEQGGDGGGESSELVLDGGGAEEEGGGGGGACTFGGGVCNLVTTAVGAGMLALPKAFATVGIVSGLLLFAAVSVITYFSTSIIVRYASAQGKRSYGELIEGEFGRTGARVLQSAIVVHAGGVMVVYLIIIGDILVGSAPSYEGVLPTLVGRHDRPWFLSRAFVVAALLAGVVAPMLLPRDLAAVSRFSRLSVGMVVLLVGIISGLATTAVAQGKAAPVDLLPDFSAMGSGSPLDVATCLLTVVSIGCLAFTCQFNLLPIQHSLKDSRTPAMLRVTCYGLGLCAALYALVAVSGYLLFGAATEGDVLAGLTVKFVAGLVPPRLAHVLIDGVAGAYTFNLLVNFVLKVWPVRDNLSELLLGRPALSFRQPALLGGSAGLVAAAFGLSIVTPGIWGIVSLVGSTACVIFSYLFPAALVLKREERRGRRAAAGGMMALGLCMATIALYNFTGGSADP